MPENWEYKFQQAIKHCCDTCSLPVVKSEKPKFILYRCDRALSKNAVNLQWFLLNKIHSITSVRVQAHNNKPDVQLQVSMADWPDKLRLSSACNRTLDREPKLV